MELTLKRLLEQAEFKSSRGRYEAGEVDDFLDKAVAMATKVEAKLTQALSEAKDATGPSPAEVEAEVARRVEAAVAERVASGPSEDETAEEVRRTIVLAQRTADAAVKEAREEAAALLAAAQERAAAIDAEADAAAEASRQQVASEAASARDEARQRLAGEIGELEGIREALRTDVTVLERHVEEQRAQLRSTVGELQRLLDDPTGFRMAPAPALLDPEVPDFAAEAAEEAAAAAPAEEPEPDPQPEPASQPDAAPEAAVADVDIVVAEVIEPEAEAEAEAESEPEPDVPQAEAPRPQALTFDEVDHAAPGLPDPLDGPPTAPVSVIDLGFDADDPGPGDPVASTVSSGASSSASSPAPGSRSPATGGEEDAFLAELRKAMQDDEPLGPRDQQAGTAPGEMYDEGGRSWRFGKRR